MHEPGTLDHVISEQRHHQRSPRVIRVRHNPLHQRPRIDRRIDDQLLALLHIDPDFDGDFGQAIQFLVMRHLISPSIIMPSYPGSTPSGSPATRAA